MYASAASIFCVYLILSDPVCLVYVEHLEAFLQKKKKKVEKHEMLPQQPQRFLYEIDHLLAFPWSVVVVFVSDEFMRR